MTFKSQRAAGGVGLNKLVRFGMMLDPDGAPGAAAASGEGATPPAATTATNDKPASTGAGAPAATTKAPASEDDLEAGEWLNGTNLDESQKKYLRRVMSENKNRREKLKEVESKLTEKEKKEAEDQRKKDEETGNWKKIADETEAKLKAKDERIKRAEVRAAAVKAGIIDPSDIDLLPLDGVEISDAGDVSGVDKFVSKWKKDKPHMFGAEKKGDEDPEGTTTPAAAPPANGQQTTKDALKMTDKEFKEELDKIMQQGGIY